MIRHAPLGRGVGFRERKSVGQPTRRRKGLRQKARPREADSAKHTSGEAVSAREHAELVAVFEGIDDIIYVSDPETYELVYVNERMRRRVGDTLGGRCYFALHGRGSPCPFCTNDVVFQGSLGDPVIWEYHSNVDGSWFRCVDRAIRWPDGRLVKLEVATDITEQKRVEAALKESEEKHRRVLENAQEAIVVVQDGMLKYFNPKLPEETGYSPEELQKVPFLELVAPEDRRLVADRYTRRIRGEAVPSSYCFRIVTKQGDVKWLEINAVLFQWEGRPATLNFITDITERRAAEEALRESRERYANLFRHSHDGIFVYDLDGNILEVNDAGLAQLGYAEDEILGLKISALHPPEASESFRRAFETVIRDGAVSFEIDFQRADGGIFPAEVSARVFDSPGKKLVQGIVRDITERRRAEEAIKEIARFPNENPSPVLRVSRDGIILYANDASRWLLESWGTEVGGPVPDEWLREVRASLQSGESREAELRSDHQVLSLILAPVPPSGYVNIYGRDITGLKQAQEVQSVLFHISQAVTESSGLPALLTAIHEQLGRLIDTTNFYVALYDEQTDTYTFPYHVDEIDKLDDLTPVQLKRSLTDYVRRTGRPLLVDEETHRRLEEQGEIELVGTPSPIWLGVPLKIGQRVIGVVVVQSYVEGSLYTQKDLEIMTFVSDNIARAIERVRAEEERQRLEAQIQHAQKLESLGVLAGGIAHDFNNLLTGILGNADLALMDLAPDSPAYASLTEIKATAQRAADLSRQMLAYSGKGSFVIEPIDLNQVVREMGHLMEVSISKKAVLRYELSDDLPAIIGDATQIRQVIMNLITNASDAIGDDEGVISIRSGTEECDHDYLGGCYLNEQLPEGLYVYLEVTDDGCGMDRDTMQRIFDPFFTTKFTGRGLGLASTLGIVRGHHGTVRVKSEPGRGTRFRVLLPASQIRREELARPKVAPQRWSGAGTVLIVDDEEAVREVAARMLEQAGLTVVTAADGREAVEFYRRHADEIGCVLLDLTMPHMSGEETLQELRRIRSDVRVVVSSGYSEQEVVSRFVDKGISGFVQKPYLVSKLVSEVSGALGDAH